LLHLKNRISKAILEHLLLRAFRLREGNSSLQEELVKAVELEMNTQIFGTHGCSSFWSCPLNSNGAIGK